MTTIYQIDQGQVIIFDNRWLKILQLEFGYWIQQEPFPWNHKHNLWNEHDLKSIFDSPMLGSKPKQRARFIHHYASAGDGDLWFVNVFAKGWGVVVISIYIWNLISERKMKWLVHSMLASGKDGKVFHLELAVVQHGKARLKSAFWWWVHVYKIEHDGIMFIIDI